MGALGRETGPALLSSVTRDCRLARAFGDLQFSFSESRQFSRRYHPIAYRPRRASAPAWISFVFGS
jgi:hypothetical protein